VALLDAIRALARFEAPRELPPCDLDELGEVLLAHGLAPLASYHLETRPLGTGLPDGFREKLLAVYQGVVNDNVFRLLTLKGVLKAAADVPAVLLGGAAWLDWLYPHMAFRPVGDLTLVVNAADGKRFADAVAGELRQVRTEAGGSRAVFSDGKLEVAIQEALGEGLPPDPGVAARGRRLPALGPSALRPSAEDALIATVAEQASLGLHAPLITYIDLRELLARGVDAAAVKERAQAVGLGRALHGSMALLGHFFPETAPAAAALAPALGAAERRAVEAVIESARDPGHLRQLRGAGIAARALLVPWRAS
jgi:hypothetical protein